MDIIEHIKIKATLAKQFHIQPSEIDKMPYWEYMYFIEMINNMVKEENEAQEEQAKKYNIQGNMRSIKKSQNLQPPKTPTMPRIPSFK